MAKITTAMKGNRTEPLRTCISCRERFNKSALIRMTLQKGRIAVDIVQTAVGRGCYTCKPCLTKLDIKMLRRAFRSNRVAKEDVEALRQYA